MEGKLPIPTDAGAAHDGHAPWWGDRPRTVLLFVFLLAFIAGAGVAKLLAVIPETGISVWPPGGLLLAALLLSRGRHWPWWLLAAILAELIANALWFRNAVPLALAIIAGNCAAGLVGAMLIRHFNPGRAHRVQNLRDVLSLVVFGALVAPAVSATVGATALFAAKSRSFIDSWTLFWVGDATGTLLIAPLMLVAVRTWQVRTGVPLFRIVEFCLLLVTLVISIAIAVGGRLPLVYLVIPPLVWAAIRFYFGGAVVALVVLSVMATAYTVNGTGQFATGAGTVRESQVMLQLFLAISSVLILVVAAISRQNRSMIEQVRASNAMLEERVAQRTEELRISEERYRQTADAMAQIVWVVSADGEIEFLNRRWFEYVGDSSADGKFQMSSDAIHPDDRLVVAERWQWAMANGQAFEAEYRLMGADGRYRWFLGRTLPMHDSKGQVIRWYGTSTDIDILKQLQQDNERLVQLVANSNDFIAIFELDGRSRYVNPAGLQLLGLANLAEAQQLDAFSMILADDLRLLSQSFMKEVEQEGSASREIRLRNAVNGAPTWMDCRVFPIRNAEGNSIAYATISQVTESRRATDEMQRQLISDLSLADQRKDEFLATLAHELRNPLTPIVNATELLHAYGRNRQGVQEATAMLMRQVGQLVRLVDDLLDSSRVSLGKISLRKEHVRISELVDGAIEMTRQNVLDKDHRISVQVDADLPAVNGDRIRLTQILSNLINNACKFTPSGGHIDITAIRDNRGVRIIVRDDGIGIDADAMDRIFRMFGQVSGAQGVNTGLGIGLSLARSLAEMHGGSISAHSEGKHRGSEFVLTLPEAVALASPERPSSDVILPDADPVDQKPSVLIADDNEDAAISLAMLLDMHGYEVTTVSSGEAALESSARLRPDVILLDIGMPGMSGYEVAQHLRLRDREDCPRLIALTGWGQASDRERSRKAGFDAHLVKPASLEQLLPLLVNRPAAVDAQAAGVSEESRSASLPRTG